MNYYTISYKYKRTRKVINLGDNIQSLAVVDMLKNLSITEDQVDYIVRSEMGIRNPNRKKGIFIPATGGLAWNTYPNSDDLPINDYNMRILYFGTRIPDGMFDAMRHYDAFIASMKKYEPIGCRDVATRDYLRSLGVKAFFSKCTTIGFNFRHKDIRGSKIFKISVPQDVDDLLKEIMPPYLNNKVEYLSQDMDSPSNGPMSDEDALLVNQMAWDRLELLKREALLVITKRIHVAMPCASMGIPVIFLNKTNGSRTAVARSILPVYTAEMLKEYDWSNIVPTDISKAKHELQLLFTYRLQQEEWKMGLKTERLSPEEFKEAGELLEKRCQEEEPKNIYTPLVFSTEVMVSALLGEKKEEVSKVSRPVVLFGAGDLSRRLLVILRRYGINPVCFCDNKISDNETAWYQDLPLISFKQLVENHKNSFIIIGTYYPEEEIKEQLVQHNFNSDYIIGCKDYFITYREYLPPPVIHRSDFM